MKAEDYDRVYLATEDPRAQSGYRGSDTRWEAARRLIVSGIDAKGTLLDVGCANGLLMESIVKWSVHAIEPYGIDFAAGLVSKAKERLPAWRDRIEQADVRTWNPPRVFDFVHIRLDMCELRDVRSFARRVIVSADGSYARPESEKAAAVAEILRARGWTIADEVYERNDRELAEIRVAWTP